MFSSVYDYPYLSSSANHIFDATIGLANTSPLSSSTTSQLAKKLNVYNQMAQYLVGYDQTGSIKKFTMPTTNAEMHSCYFVPFARLLTKDEVKKGSFTMELAISGNYAYGGTLFNKRVKLTDASGSAGYYVDSPAGEYGVLYASTSVGNISMVKGETGLASGVKPAAGLLYYQAGIAVLSGSVFNTTSSGGLLRHLDRDASKAATVSRSGLALAGLSAGVSEGFSTITASTIETMNYGLRNRIYNISYNNTTELNSTIYFCRVAHNDFNYSSNPTYLSSSQIRVKTRASDTPVSFITTVGLYSADNELLAVAKLSEPLKKDPTNEITLRVRLDY